MAGTPHPAVLYDGQTALRHDVHVLLDGKGLTIVETGERIALGKLRATGERAAPSYRHVDRPGWQLNPDVPLPTDWEAALPRQERYGGLLDRIDMRLALPVATVIGVAVFFGLAAGSAAVARLIPLRWEIALGERVSGGLDRGRCEHRAGRMALDRLTRSLAGDGSAIRIAVIDLPIVNAAALPGRQIIVFRGLIDAARSPDEVAGVIAHEIGHVERRHPLIALVRGYGLSLLIGGIDGGALMQVLLADRYSRADERAADEAGIVALKRAAISPQATAAFFDRLAQSELSGRAAALAAFLSTHPPSAERRTAYLAAAVKMRSPRRALEPEEWRALRTICR